MSAEVPKIFPSPDARMEHLTRFLFTAPPWYLSLLLASVPGILVDLLAPPVPGVPWAGTLLLSLPAAAAFLLTPPLIRLSGGAMTWNRSALLALCCTFFQLATILPGLVLPFPGLFPFLYAFSLGLVSGIRLLVLVAIADYRPPRVLLPALLQGLAGLAAGASLPLAGLVPSALVALLTVGAGSLLLVQLIEYPLDHMLHVRTFGFINAFLAHLTDGSPGMDDWFRRMGEEVSVPQATLVLHREGRPEILLTVPNLHPGPAGDAGGGTLPRFLHEALGGQTLVAHGCGTHDFNPVGTAEFGKVLGAVRASLGDLRFHEGAGRSARVQHGSVSILAQRFGNTLLAVGTRAPERTEDLEASMAPVLMAEARPHFRHLLFVEAHNSMTEVSGGIHYGTPIATEYVEACREAAASQAGAALVPFRAGASRVPVPFGREQGFGELGVQALVTEADGQRTAYVLLDGNNIVQGARELLRDAVLGRVDDAEIMTTDSHVVNTITGKNPVGLAVPPGEIVPYALRAVDEALADLAPATAGGATACIRGIVVFGTHRIAQVAAAVTATMTFLGPLGVAVFLCAYLLSLITYISTV